MSKAPLAYALMLVALCAFFLFIKPGGDLRKTLRGARKHGPRVKLVKEGYNLELEHIPFDPVIAEAEQRQEDATWERAHAADLQGRKPETVPNSGHPATGIDDFLDHHLEGTPDADPDFDDDDNDYINYLEDGFNFTARIEALFPMVDADGNGAITLGEMWAWHRALAKNQSLHRSDREMSVILHGKDGKVALADYLHDPNEGQEGAKEWSDHSLKWVTASRRKFPLADADGDGKLDRLEFDDFLHPEDSDNEKLQRFVRQEEIRERDSDGDEKLSFAEFLGGMYDVLRDVRAEEEEDARLGSADHRPDGPGSDIDDRQRRPGGKWSEIKHRRDYVREQSALADRRLERARRRFEELDRDKNGFLTEDELVSVIDALNPGESYFARLQAESLLNLADDNKDGELSLQEMLKHKHSFYRTIEEDDEIFIHDEF